MAALLAIGAIAVVALAPAAGAARGGTNAGTGLNGCVDLGDTYCDNTHNGKTITCELWAPHNAISIEWTVGERPDKNKDGIVCWFFF